MSIGVHLETGMRLHLMNASRERTMIATDHIGLIALYALMMIARDMAIVIAADIFNLMAANDGVHVLTIDNEIAAFDAEIACGGDGEIALNDKMTIAGRRKMHAAL
jgi:hypothetical protein